MAITSRKCLAASAFLICTLYFAQAATFNVADGDVNALKNAITTSNTNGQNDVINLVSGSTYTLTSVDNNFSNGLPILRADGGHSLTINGSRTTIMRSTAGGTPPLRILQIGSGAVVTLNGVIISDGNIDESDPAGAVPGAGIHNDHGTLTLLNSTVKNNHVSDSQVSVAMTNGKTTACFALALQCFG